ncbi:MAG: hypothetical protein KatS3mg105_1629 [Gemmatales bacterium]|nr:MAG: hypothetical protein KatS3mg105_1629 [Gemmatales bacterium]
MRPVWGVGPVAALLLLAWGTGPASAAWCNVFQVTCCQQPSVSYSVSAACCDPCPQPCPQPVCTTRYVQRCYYQPVTTYKTQTYYQQVTTYRTSYYYEPVTTYRYSCYFDPCTCTYKQIACPTTSYRLRSRCCPVTSWVQRCCRVPVTTYELRSYWEPQTTCCYPPADPCCPTACPSPAPAVTEQRSYTPPANTMPKVQEYRAPSSSGSPLYDRRYSPPPANTTPPPPQGSSTKNGLAPAQPAPPRVRLDRIVSIPRSELVGQVVRDDHAPKAGARLMFVSAEIRGPRREVTTDHTGNFRVALDSGAWLVYIRGEDNRAVFHSKIDVRATERRRITLVSR